MIEEILPGDQTGADRAAQDWAEHRENLWLHRHREGFGPGTSRVDAQENTRRSHAAVLFL